MIKHFAYPVKNKNIRVFKEEETPEGVIRHYLHPKGTTLKAYIRQLSSAERSASGGIQDGSQLLIVINVRKTIKQDMYIDFVEEGKVYQLGAPDRLQFENTELKLMATEVDLKEYIKTIYDKEWLK